MNTLKHQTVGGVYRLKNLNSKRSLYLEARDIEISENTVMAQLESGIHTNIELQAEFLCGAKFVFEVLFNSDVEEERSLVVERLRKLDANTYGNPSPNDVELVRTHQKTLDVFAHREAVKDLQKTMRCIICGCGTKVPSWKFSSHVCREPAQKAERQVPYRYA